MKKLYKSLLFIALLFVPLSLISLAITFGARHSPVVPMAKINKMMNHEIDPEMIIFGPSTAWVNFNPEIISRATGLSVFNMGLNGTPLPEYQGLAREYILYAKKCKHIVFAISIGEFSIRNALYQPYKFYAYVNNDNIYKALFDLQPGFAWRMRYVPFYSFTAYTSQFYQGAKAGWLAAAGKKMVINEKDNGFFPMHRTWEESQERKNREAKDILTVIDDKRLSMFRELASAFSDGGFIVVTVIPPIQQDGQRLIRDIGSVRNAILKSIPPGSPFLDYTGNEMCNDKSYFYNNTHLNYIGADYFSEIFSHDFIRLVKANRK